MSFVEHDNRFPRESAPADENTIKRGTWRLTYEKGHPAALIACPCCGVTQQISPSRINIRGAVDPAVTCGACPWFDYVQLDTWAGAT